ncbi:MAG: Bax inhibitor-1/YccA family protein [Chlamydiales bacterium]|nr:Bax inhibitor-1/YccA family protein [Chlamydiales bacterium]
MGLTERDYVFGQASSQMALSSFTTKVYGWMTAGLALTAAVAYFIYASELYQTLMPMWWFWGIATFGIAMVITTMLQKLSVPALALLFLGYSALEGVFFGTLLPGYAAAFGGGVIWSAFAVAAIVFLMAAVYGVFTKSDLTKIGRILSFAVVGLIAVTLLYFILSFFIQLTWMNLLISYIGLIVFVGLTAFDAQQIRMMSYQASGDTILVHKLSLVMALRMYINVIMVFWYLLQIFSSSRR